MSIAPAQTMQSPDQNINHAVIKCKVGSATGLRMGLICAFPYIGLPRWVPNSSPIKNIYSAGNWGLGSTCHPEEAVSALKNTHFFAHYIILRVYTVMHSWENTCDLDYLDDNGLPTILLKEKVAVGAHTASLQCYSVLSDILVKIELCIPLERGSNVLSTGEGFICLSPPSKLKIAVHFCSIYKKTISFSAIVF